MTALTSGSGNVSLGRASGTTITTGSNNTVIGKGADVSANSGTNQIVIGQGATGHGDNIAVIGNGSATAIHPHDNNEVDLGSSSCKFKNLHLAGSAIVGVVTVSSDATFNGSENIIAVNTSSGTVRITIDTDQLVSGRTLIIKKISGGNAVYINTEGSEKLNAGTNVNLDQLTFGSDVGTAVHLFSDGSHWYDIIQN